MQGGLVAAAIKGAAQRFAINGHYIGVHEQSKPQQTAYDIIQGRTGKRWAFRHWVHQGDTSMVDDYREIVIRQRIP